MAAYVPPHKRHGVATSSKPLPAPPPGLTVSNYQRKNNNTKPVKTTGIVFSKTCLTKWFVVGLDAEIDDDESVKISSFTRLEPVVTESTDRKSALVLKENCEEEARREFSEKPWMLIAETVKEDFAVSLQKVKDVIMASEIGDMKPYLLVRFGKVLFNGNHLSGLEYTKGTLGRARKNFHTNVAPSYMQSITDDAVPRSDFELLEEKDVYLIVLSDHTQPGLTISCKCDVNKETQRLQLRKFIVNPLRHFVADVTCLEKDLDLRLMLLSKRCSYSVTEKDLEKIKDLISCAIIDQGVKGGLKWPLGKMTSFDQRNIVSVWHTAAKTFKNSAVKLQVRTVDRYEFRTSEGEIAREVFFKMTNIKSKLGEETLDTEATFEMLKDGLELIWKQFLV